MSVLVALATATLTLFLLKTLFHCNIEPGMHRVILGGIISALLFPLRGMSLKKSLVAAMLSALITTLLLYFVVLPWFS